MTDSLERDDDVWTYARRRWNEPTLDANAIAGLLGVSPSGVRQSLLVDPEFPAPQERGANGRNLWTPAAVYPYVRAAHSRRREFLPRLWSPTVNPGRFLGARTIELPIQLPADERATEDPRWPDRTLPGPREKFVAHLWQPSDESGPIAIAFPINVSQAPRHSPRQAAIRLFDAERLPGITAVAVPLGDASRVVRPGHVGGGVSQPAMAVVDTSTFNAEREQDRVVEYGWYEVAGLLQTDLPWWPYALRDEAAMLTWRPGDAVQRILPATGAYAPHPLLALIAEARPAMSSTLRGIVEGLAADIANRLGDSARAEANCYPQHRGLIHAAEADCDPDYQPQRELRRFGDIALLLHHIQADPRLADRALAAVNGHPVVNTTMTIRPDLARHPLVAGWLEGLRPVEDPQRIHGELGFRLFNQLRPDPRDRPASAVIQWCTHRNDPNVWAGIAADETVYTTVGSAVPALGGRLAAVLVTTEAAFFQTTRGEIWPLPHKYLAGYSAGYAGSGPSDLTQTLSRLLLDAAADVDDYDGRVPDDPRVHKIVRNQDLPLELTFTN